MVIEIHNKFYTAPVQWNDLSRKQLLNIMKVLHSEVGEVEGRVKIMQILTGISSFRLWFVGILDIDDKLYLTDFLLQENKLTRNVINHYRGLYGPADDFNNLIVSEFIFAEQYYSMYQESKEVDHLNHLIACIYRPAKFFYNKKLNKDGDVRRDFNDHLVNVYARKISGWPLHVKQAILTWYEGCRNKMINDNPAVFTGTSSGEPALHGLYSIMRGVAEKGIHGNLEKVERMYVKVFMMELNEHIAEAERIEKAHKK